MCSFIRKTPHGSLVQSPRLCLWHSLLPTWPSPFTFYCSRVQMVWLRPIFKCRDLGILFEESESSTPACKVLQKTEVEKPYIPEFPEHCSHLQHQVTVWVELYAFLTKLLLCVRQLDSSISVNTWISISAGSTGTPVHTAVLSPQYCIT